MSHLKPSLFFVTGLALFLILGASPAFAKGNRKKTPATPTHFLKTQVNKIWSEIEGRPVRPLTLLNSAVDREIQTAARKNEWLKEVYSKNLVEASPLTAALADKLIMAQVLEKALGPQAEHYYPRTIGLRQFLEENALVNKKGRIVASGEQLDSLLHQKFSAGFVVRPAVGVAPRERSKGLYADSDEFIVDLLKPQSPLYQPSLFLQPIKSHILGRVTSGEAAILQENVIAWADAKKPLKNRFYEEVRIHTFENQVVSGAVPSRWVQKTLLQETQVTQAEKFVQEFLGLLPASLVTRQAWGVDVAVFDNGQMKIVDIVTNRGIAGSWSSYLEQPRVLAAYTRHLEGHCGVHFTGLPGWLLRHGWGNYKAFWKTRIEKAKPGLDKTLAYLPPWP